MRVFTVLGPSHSGKTTLVDAMSSLDGREKKFSVADAVSLRTFTYLDEPWAAIDIAGGPDNLAYAGPALAASDVAVLCVAPEPDAAVLTAPYLSLIESADIPCYIFVNKMDTSTERVRDIIASIQTYCQHSIVLRQIPMRSGSDVTGAVDLISERAWQYREGQPSALIELPEGAQSREQEARTELLESLADFDDALLEQLIEDKRPATDEVFDLAARVLQHNELHPAFLGAASHGNGVNRLMKSLRHEAPGIEVTKARISGDDETRAVGFLAEIKRHMGKIVVLRAFGPGVGAGKELGGDTIGSVTEIDTKTAVPELAPGDIGIVVKSDHLDPGRLFTGSGAAALPDWARSRPPSFRNIVSPVHERDEVRLSTALTRLAEIDPGLVLEQDELTGKAVLAVQGPLHARRLTETLAEDFGIETEMQPVPPDFRETITKTIENHHRHRKQSGGAGQFADVVIEISPQPRGAGFSFDEVVKGGAVPRNYIPAVMSGAEEALREGPNGYPVVDVAVTLKDGKHHAVDSSDHAFRTAGKNAVREAVQDAGPVMLQPIMHVDIHVPSVFSGGLVPTISGLKGQVLGFEGNPEAAGWDIFSALLPASAADDLFRALGSATRGTAWAVSAFDHYEQIHAADVAKATGSKSLASA